MMCVNFDRNKIVPCNKQNCFGLLVIISVVFFSTGTVYAQTFELVDQFGSFGSSLGDLDTPSEVAVNSTHIFVADTGNNRIQIFDLSGNVAGQFGSYGSGLSQFVFPLGIAVNSTHIFVADTDNTRIQIFDLSGNFAGQFYFNPQGFELPIGITVDSNHIFVIDQDATRIQIFDLSGNAAGQFGSYGLGPDEF